MPIKIKKPILAVGAQTKNTVCFAKNNFAFISTMHSDLDSPEDFLNFQRDLKYFFRESPKLIAHDLHPEYQSTKYIDQLSTMNYQLSAVQHHHAHIASCMAENGLRSEKVMGVAFDGTGLGSDNKLWGAEFLICDYKHFKRIAHLREIPLLGGEQAIKEPYRLTLAWLYLLDKEKFLNLKINFIRGIDKKKWPILKKMLLSGFNSPYSSSMGRLFDAVASLILVKYKANFEAELAMELERLALSFRLSAPSYKFKIIKGKEQYILDPSLIFKDIIRDLKLKAPADEIAYRFHLTVADMINKTCKILRNTTGINKVVLSGGVFQNKLLLRLSLGLLSKAGFNVLTHKELSCSDSGISLGQAMVANYI